MAAIERTLEKLRSIHRVIYAPFLLPEEAQEFLSHRLEPRKSKAVILANGLILIGTINELGQPQFETIDISDIDPSIFRDSAGGQFYNLSTATELLDKESVKTILRTEMPGVNFSEFDVQQLESGGKLVIKVRNGKSHIMAVSKRNPTFFDLFAGNAEKRIYDFSNTGQPKTHSGDKTTNDNILIQYLLRPEGRQVIGVNGYSNNPLHRYAANRPLTLVIDHYNKIIYIVPVPLDEATVGQNTTCIVLGTQVLKSYENGDCDILVEVLESPPTCLGDIGSLKIPDNRTIEAALSQLSSDPRKVARSLLAPPPLPPAAGGGAEESKSSDKPLTPPLVQSGDLPTAPVVFVSGNERSTIVEGLSGVFKMFGCNTLYFIGPDGAPLPTIHRSGFDIDFTGKTHLPVLSALLGPLEGGKILLTAENIRDLNSDQATETINHLSKQSPLTVVTSDMDDAARNAASSTIKINATFVIERRVTTAVLDNPMPFLDDLCQNAATALRGPLSVVFACLIDQDSGEQRFYYIDGIIIPGLLDHRPAFGERLDLPIRKPRSRDFYKPINMSEIMEYISTNAMSDSKYDLESKVITWKAFTPDQRTFEGLTPFIEFVTSMDIDTIIAEKDAIEDSLIQIQVIFSDSEIKPLVSELCPLLTALIESDDIHARTQLNEIVRANEGDLVKISTDIKEMKQSEEYKRVQGNKAEYKRELKSLIQTIGRLASSKNKSTQGFSAARQAIKDRIYGNVGAAKEMSVDDIIKYLDEICDPETGCMILMIKFREFATCLRAIKDGQFEQHICRVMDQALPGPIKTALDRCLDITTVDSLLEVTREINHQFKGDQSLALPDRSGESSFMLPILLMFVNMKSCYQNWVDLNKHPDIAKIRILLRGTLVHGSGIRNPPDGQPGMAPLQPQDKNIGIILMYFIRTAIVNLGEGKDHLRPDFSDGIAKLMRNLFGWYISVAASGQNPLCKVYQLFTNNACLPDIPKTELDWQFYMVAMKYIRITAWDDGVFRNRVKMLLVHCLEKVVIKLTEPLRRIKADAKKEDKINSAQHSEEMQKEFHPAYLTLVHYLRSVLQGSETLDKAKVSKMMDIFTRFKNRKVRVGSIHTLTVHLAKNLENRDFVEKFVEFILYKYTHYDKLLKWNLLKLLNSVSLGPDGTITKLPSETDIKKVVYYRNFRQDNINHLGNGGEFGPKTVPGLPEKSSVASALKFVSKHKLGNKVSKTELARLEELKTIIFGEGEDPSWFPDNHPPTVDDDAAGGGAAAAGDDESKDCDSDTPQEVCDFPVALAVLGDHFSQMGALIATEGSDQFSELSKLSNFPSTDIMLLMCQISGLGETPDEVLPHLKNITEILFSTWEMSAPEAVFGALGVLSGM